MNKLEAPSGPVVYVMGGYGAPDHYKIGCTTNLRQRYQSQRSRERITHLIPASGRLGSHFELERLIHELFSVKCVNRFETFALNNADLETVARLQRSSDPYKLVRRLIRDCKPGRSR